MRKAMKKCSCCGGHAGSWKQWHNRDEGFGICGRCVRWMLDDRHMDAEELKRNYGEPGVHYEETKA